MSIIQSLAVALHKYPDTLSYLQHCLTGKMVNCVHFLFICGVTDELKLVQSLECVAVFMFESGLRVLIDEGLYQLCCSVEQNVSILQMLVIHI